MRGSVALVIASAAVLLTSSCGMFGEPRVPSIDKLRSTEHLAQTISTSGEYVADSGFRPEPNGFSFPNYGDSAVPGAVANLGAPQLVELFGDDVCVTGTGAACRLSSAATTWVQAINNSSAGGHCEGMAAMSVLLYTGNQSPAAFGGDSAYALPFDDNTALQRQISRWFATQYTAPTQQSEIFDTPNKILDVLIDKLPQGSETDETYTLGIFQPDMTGGHAITPYAVEDRGEGIYWIMVYDNNYPGQERAIAVDRERNEWSYLASTNPDIDPVVYIGTDETETLTLTPTAARLETQQCPFCGGELDEEVAGGGTNQFSLTGPGSLDVSTDFYLTDAADQRLGRVDGTQVKEIADGTLLTPRTGIDDAPTPFINAPAALDVTVTIASEQPATDMDFAMIGAGYDVLIDGIDSPAGGQTTVTLNSDATKVTYTQVPRTGPTISVGAQDDDGYQFDIDVALEQFAADNPTVELIGDDETDVARIGSPNVAGQYSLVLNVFAPDDSAKVLRLPTFDLEAGQSLELGLPGNGEVTAAVVDDDGDLVQELSIIDDTLPVPRQLG